MILILIIILVLLVLAVATLFLGPVLAESKKVKIVDSMKTKLEAPGLYVHINYSKMILPPLTFVCYLHEYMVTLTLHT